MGRVEPPATTPPWSFFSLLQKNVLDRRRWDTRTTRIAIVTWIERTYHRRRRRRLGRLTPSNSKQS
ncbi:hypothetical protein [Mycolicibacterium aubagnense]|uniref:Integrase catalytic domain-containing protein n=1 Tax=Mycolicibacterium aubagnense TaxID=319707 RepID=A0ABN5YXD0_9MYCO|nr:hypothetical protein [Mycolicibacterium aubagnense]BBX85556.1 hypothetical protein MAUB_34290 [Mycolicibacterium aubagnense]